MKLPERLTAAFFPTRCAFCGRVQPPGKTCCDACEAALPRILPPVCPSCGWQKKDCRCLGAKHPFTRIAAPFYYEGIVRRGIWQFKFRNRPSSARRFGEEIASAVRREYEGVCFDGVLFVPLSKRGLRERGYDQARLVAEEAARQLHLPLLAGLIKCAEIKAQHTLPLRERRGNVIGAYRYEGKPLGGLRLLLIDDISTSGATLGECAKVLRLAGAKEVYAAAIALRR